MTDTLPADDQALAQQLVMVDNRPLSLKGFADLVAEYHAPCWNVEILETAQAFLHRLDTAFPRLPQVVSINLGLPPDEDSPRHGLELLELVHRSYPGLLIVVHGGIVSIPDWAVQYILSIPATCISTASDQDIRAYAQMLPWIAQGFRIFSPRVGEMLSRVVLQHPDPLYADEWRIVELMTKGMKTLQIAKETGYAEATINERVQRIAHRLDVLGHLDVNVEDSRPIPNRCCDALTRFYQENAVRYGRHRRT